MSSRIYLNKSIRINLALKYLNIDSPPMCYCGNELEFLVNNHLDGWVPASKHIGLFYENNLVSVLSYGKSRFKRDELEVLRFASLLNTIIVGGYSKIIKYISLPLVTYANRRFSSILKKNVLSTKYEITPPNWYGFDKTYQLRHRLYYTKQKLIEKIESYDHSKSVYENMLENGIDRIWDSGHIKYYI